MHHYILFSFLLFIFLLFIFFLFFNNINHEYFSNLNTTWNDDLIARFIKYQETVNLNNYQFNIDILQKQASPKEAEYLLKHGIWPWPNYLKYEFINYISNNPIIKIDHNIALNNAMKIYNKNAITQILAFNTKEGQFLLYGINIPSSHNNLYSNTIKCSSTNNPYIEKITTLGHNSWNGFINTKTEIIDNKDLPKTIPGFSFVNTPCNPCSVFNDPPNYNCAFKLNINNNNNISYIWKKIWNL